MNPELSMAIVAAQEAGVILMQHFRTELDVKNKADQFDPVTKADLAADELLRKTIAAAFPRDTILSEEYAARPDSYKGRVWMVDPLDGTKDFIAGRDTFSIIIGLLVENRPTIGVVFVPAKNELFYAQTGEGAFFRGEGVDQPIKVGATSSLETARMSVRIPTKEIGR
jgi:histidinol-phosphatase